MGAREWLSKALREAADRVAPADMPSPGDLDAPASMTVGATQIPQDTEEAMYRQGMQTGGPFAPGRPLNQFFPWGQPPRQWDYPTGYNIATRPRAVSSKMSFDTMRNILESYDVARICIERREDEIRGLDWSIVPDDTVEDGEDMTDQIRQVMKFFEKPDGVTPFDSWQQMFLDDVLSFDAGAIYARKTRGGKLGALEVVDGTSIAPLIDFWGRPPDPPAPAFTQFVQGIPAVWLTKDELIYQPFRMTPRSPYGFPPVEWLILNINTDVRWQWYFLQYFTEGTVPDTFMEAPPDLSSPKQLAEWQELWDAVMTGDQAMKHKVKWIPAGSKPTPAKTMNFNSDFNEFLLLKTCAAFKVTPEEIGYTRNSNRASGEMQENVTYRASLVPLTKYLAGIYTRVIREHFGYPLKFQFSLGEKEDKLTEARTHQIYIQTGVESVDEVRKNVLGLDPDPDRPVPRFILTGQGPIPVDMVGPVAAHNTGEPPDDDMAVLDELKKWKQNTKRRIKQGKAPKAFDSDVIPPVVYEQVWEKLQNARTPEEVDAAFAGPFFW